MAGSQCTEIICILCCTILFTAVITFFTLLGTEVITIPYLTPIGHFLITITDFLGYNLHPITYVLFPLCLGAFIKVEKGRKWNGRESCLFIIGSQLLSFMLTFYGHVRELYKWNRVNKMGGIGEFCGAYECSGQWVEFTLVGVVFLGAMCNAKWDGGWVQKRVETLAENGGKKLRETQASQEIESMERGVDIGDVDEKVEDEKAGTGEGVEA